MDMPELQFEVTPSPQALPDAIRPAFRAGHAFVARRKGAPSPTDAFEHHVERTARRLETWRAHLDAHDRRTLDDEGGAPGPDVVASMHAPVFFDFLDDCQIELARLVAGFDAEVQRRAGERLRERLMPWLAQSQFLARTIERPRGYAGDAEMMRMIYDRAFVGPTSFAKLMHRHPIESHAAQAVRNRRELIPQLLGQVESRLGVSRPHAVNVLSVACGPAWELRDVYKQAGSADRYRCTLLDQDAEALDLARAGLEELARSHGHGPCATFARQSVKTLLRSAEQRASLGRFHFVYSMGLFDYLPDRVARDLTACLYDMLEPGGTLVVGNYHVASPTRTYMQYWMNWPLEYRTESQLLALAPAGGEAATLSFDATGAQMFLRVDRAG